MTNSYELTNMIDITLFIINLSKSWWNFIMRLIQMKYHNQICYKERDTIIFKWESYFVAIFVGSNLNVRKERERS